MAIVAIATLSPALAQNKPIPDAAAWNPATADVEAGRSVAVGAFAMRPAPQAGGLSPAQGACFRCHGIDGRGDGAAVFPRLTDQAYGYLYESLRHYASGARQNAIMTPIAQALTDAQMRDVSAYYAAQKSAPYGDRPAADPAMLQLGAALAAVGSAQRGVQGCFNCHGPEGVGLPPVYPYLAGQYANYIEAQLIAWKMGQRGGGEGSAVMADIARRLNETEINAVSLYFASMRPEAVTPEAAELRPLTGRSP